MRYLIDAARELGLDRIIDQVMGNYEKSVHGVVVDIHPVWYYHWFYHHFYGSDERMRHLSEYYFYERWREHHNDYFLSLPYSHITAPMKMDMGWRPKFWNDFTDKSNLLVRILLRPGSAPVEISYEGRLAILQVQTPLAYLSANQTTMLRPLEGGISIGHQSNSPGTLGGILVDRQSEPNRHYALTCGHVINNVGNNADQPSQKDNSMFGSIGNCVFAQSPVPRGATLCNRHSPNLNRTDIALIELDANIM
ncbi:MAG: hypothetical protein EOP48_28195, partial [Sphingobacteriales bacterium]